MRESNNVKHVKEDVKKITELWSSIRLAVQGGRSIKANAQKFVPHPDPRTKDTREGKDRYAAYIERATWYGATASTVDGMLGQIFARDPVFTGDDAAYAMILEDADGGGVSLCQQAQDCALDVLSLGRGGIFVDFTYIDTNGVSEAQLVAGEARPYIKFFQPENIINWRERWVGNAKKLTLVVILEEADSDDDGFEVYKSQQWRELRLMEGTYWQRIWKEENGALAAGDWVQPTKANGEPFTEIPFAFVGSKNNDSSIDEPPMRDLVEVNIAHFRNSADYEESCFLCGQPTLFMSGLTEHWVKNVLKGTVTMGSRDAVPLPTGAVPTMLQAQPNGMIKEAMDQKERQMVALGAKLIDSDKTQRTLGEVSMESAAQNSVLSRVAKNVSSAYTKALKWVSEFMGKEDHEMAYELNSDFDIAKMSPEELQAVISAWQSNAISFTEMRWQIKRGGRGYMNDDDMRDEQEQEDPLRLDITNSDPNGDAGTPNDDTGLSDNGQNDQNRTPAEKGAVPEDGA